MDRQPTLEGELVAVRPLRGEDFPLLAAIASGPLVWEQHPSKDRSDPAVFRRFLDETLLSRGGLAIVDRRTGHVITTRFDESFVRAEEVEIGWTVLSRAFWGGPYSGEAKRLMIEDAARWKEAVVFRVHCENFRSQRAVEKLGAVQVGTEADARGRGMNLVFRLGLSPVPGADGC